MLELLVDIRFQVLFHSPSGVLFIFPSRYYFTIGLRFIFSLGGWSPQIPTGFHVSSSTQEFVKRQFNFNYRTFTFFGWPFQDHSFIRLLFYSLPFKEDKPYNPSKDCSFKVWAVPLSLATT